MKIKQRRKGTRKDSKRVKRTRIWKRYKTAVIKEPEFERARSS